MKNPLVSIVIPCYNHGRYLREAVESVLASSYENLEIIVVDDGSTDTLTRDVWKVFSMPKARVLHQKNQGLSAARNNGIAEAKGKYILPLDADDKISADFIERSVDVLERDDEVGIVGHKTELFGDEQGVWEIPAYQFPEILLGNCLVCSCMFRRADWALVGGYNPNMVYGWEDYDFWLSIIELGRDVYQFDAVMFYYRKHGVSMLSALNQDKEVLMRNQLVKNHLNLYLDHPEELCILLGEGKVKKKYLRRIRFLAVCLGFVLLVLLGFIWMCCNG